MSFKTVNPADLHSDRLFGYEPLECQPDDLDYDSLNQVDSAIDLSSQWGSIKQEPFDYFLNMDESPIATNPPSPSADMIFSNANSPGDFFRESIRANSPETADFSKIEAAPSPSGDAWNGMYPSPGAIVIPQERPAAMVSLVADKVKTRAETQIKIRLTVEPLEAEFCAFPRHTLAKPKHFASEEERNDIAAKGDVVYMDAFLVCAVAAETPEDQERALRRAAGEEEVPRRPQGVALSDMDKEDPAHPQNGGEVVICEGCKERERKRYDRKKKRTEDEEEFSRYENDRVIMINEKEFKKWEEVDGDSKMPSRAKQVDFAMRIACYCRHQEEKSPAGYRVIFTFKDAQNRLIAQHMSDVFHITDDHKNKEAAPEPISQPMPVAQSYMTAPYSYPSNAAVALGQYAQETPFPADNQFRLENQYPVENRQYPVENQYALENRFPVAPRYPVDTQFSVENQYPAALAQFPHPPGMCVCVCQCSHWPNRRGW